MRIYAIFILLTLFFASCKTETDKKEEISFFENDSIPIQKKIEKILEKEYLNELGLDSKQQRWLREYYKNRGYNPRWIDDCNLTPAGEKLKTTLEHSPWFGIPHNRKVFLSKKAIALWVEEEIILTASSASIFHDLSYGFIDQTEKKYYSVQFVPISAFDSLLPEKEKKEFDKYFVRLGPKDTNYRFLADHLYNFCKSRKVDTTHFQLKTFKEDTIHAFENVRLALVSKGYLDAKEKDSLIVSDKLKEFQKENGLKADGVIGKHTVIALNESTLDKVYRASIVMDRMRTSIAYPEKHIRINIPEYLLRFYVNDSLKRIHNIIVGKPENQTPQLISKVRNIVVYPYWRVPHSIASKEILPALKANSSYLAKNNYRIYRGDREVNPYGVNWRGIKENTFPYQVVQDPGPKNSLGIIKFEFHNNFSVYVHDTPTKSLFKTNVRSYSHGCMRCENPVDLGKTILDYDSVRRKRNDITADSLDSLLFEAKNYVIKLKSPVPIYVEYNTVSASKEKMTFHLDIYRRDEEYLKLMHN